MATVAPEGAVPAGRQASPESPPATPPAAPGSAGGPPPTGPTAPPRLPDLGPVGALRWAWRRLTSMRTALFLLLLLALAAIPGSLLPQRSVDPGAVAAFVEDNPDLAPWLDRLGFFTVYSSPWFAAVYLLLFTSLVGCIVPRTRAHLRDWRARPGRAPTRLDRLAGYEQWTVDGDPGQLADVARRRLRLRRWSAVVDAAGGHDREAADAESGPGGPGGSRGGRAPGAVEVAARRGRLRETGNLVFHVSMLGVLVALAGSALYSWRGEVVVVEESGFANTLPRYDSFTPGPRFDTTSLPPFSLTLDDLSVRFEEATSAGFAAPRDFEATVTLTDEPGAFPRTETVRVNDPLGVGGARLFLSGNGYAPVVEVRDGDGELIHDGPVPFLPLDGLYTSEGVVKIPDAGVAGEPDLALVGTFLPTAVLTDGEPPRNVFPDARNPVLLLQAQNGDLGLDTGEPRSVFTLDGADVAPIEEADGRPLQFLLTPGTTGDLPGGGTVTFVELRRFAALDVRADPTGPFALGASVLVIVGLGISLFVPRRSLWVRLTPVDDGAGPGRSVVEVAGQSRARDVGLVPAVQRLRDDLRRAMEERR